MPFATSPRARASERDHSSRWGGDSVHRREDGVDRSGDGQPAAVEQGEAGEPGQEAGREAAEACVPRLRYQVIDEGRYSLKDLASRKSVAAQLFWLEKSRSRQALGRGTGRLVPLLSRPEDGPLRHAVLVWIERVLMPRRRRRKPIPEALGLEEFRVMLEKRVEEWNRELREEGRLLGLKEGRKKGIQEGIQKGIQEGRQEGEAALLLRQLEHKFGRVDPKTRKRVRSADTERLLDWGQRVLTAERLEDVFN